MRAFEIKKIVNYFGVITLLLGLVLVGCGGGSDDNSSNNVNVIPTVFAPDVFELSPITEQFFVDLTRQARVSDGSAVKFTNLISLTPDTACLPASQTEKGFFISADFAKVCDFRYTIVSKSDSSASASGISRVAITDARLPSENFPSLSVFTTTDVPLTLDINSLLLNINGSIPLSANSGIPSDYLLDEYIMVLGSGTAVKGELPNTIVYTPTPGWHGVARLLYSYTNSLDNNQIKLGSIAVAVSVENNSAPVANNFKYPEPIALGVMATIDVAPYIFDTDNDELQLIDVYSWNGELAIQQVAGNFNGTKFTFKPTNNDIHYITYVVSDHRGGYGIGMISVAVGGPYSDIAVGDDLVFSGPLTFAQAKFAEISFATIDIGNGTTALTGAQTPVYTYTMAEAYCEMIGARLPTLFEMTLLYQQEGSVFSGVNKQRWPAGIVYWTQTSNSYGKETFNLHTGIQAANFSPLNAHHFVTCVDVVPIALEIVGPNRIAKGSKKTLAVNGVTAGGVRYPYNKRVYWDTSEINQLTVTEAGTVTGIAVSAPSTVAITVESENGLTASHHIWVVNEVLTLNDTGITTCASDISNGLNCTDSRVGLRQDAHFGRDAQFRDGNLIKVGAGLAGFDFTKIGVDGVPLSIQTNQWIAGDNGSETEGTIWSCLRDNHTGLTWSLWKSNSTSGDHYAGLVFYRAIDIEAWLARVNSAQHCGAKNWRLATTNEIFNIVNNSLVQSGKVFEPSYFGPNFTRSFYTSGTIQDVNVSSTAIIMIDASILYSKHGVINPVLIHDPF
ncbi:hypothetical protein CKQ84_06605 [Shewanella sp. WE21]|jgi:hypothetical protein|uniref:DUF1566 domain-containing protein n=1 Tax=Shewanella sp. WE21 TaxID=2029986 RepID=UPI000CF749F0|nr:DUF1566 domain-containing protein [Shewanella sp. WE21]AVI65582.1 hypothetical protein CKQ84_06605 [Shewanella sp. WE21]